MHTALNQYYDRIQWRDEMGPVASAVRLKLEGTYIYRVVYYKCLLH